jgi:membrane-associated phospholipid phosphatase
MSALFVLAALVSAPGGEVVGEAVEEPPSPVVAASAAAPAPSDAKAVEEPFDVEMVVDLPIIALTGSIYLASEVIGDQMTWAGCLHCDPRRLGPLDRRVLDNNVRGAAPASDVFLYSSLVIPIVADLGDVLGNRRSLKGWGEDAVVLIETATVNAALTSAVKFAIGRPRPYSYGLNGSDRDPTEGDARLSFYSGHTSTAFAMATAYSYLFTARHPRSPWVAPVWLLGYAYAGTTGALRVAAGKHFWSDVVVGAIAGAAIGLAIPAAHRVNKTPIRALRNTRLSASSDGATSMVRVIGAF